MGRKILDLSQENVTQLKKGYFSKISRDTEEVVLPKNKVRLISPNCIEYSALKRVNGRFEKIIIDLKYVNFEDTLIEIMHLSNVSNSKIEKLILPETVKEIDEVLAEAHNLKIFDMSRTQIQCIGDSNEKNSIINCEQLEEILFSNEFRELRPYSIVKCGSIKRLDFSGTKLESIQKDSIIGCDRLQTILVPANFSGFIDSAYQQIVKYGTMDSVERVDSSDIESVMEKLKIMYDNVERLKNTPYIEVSDEYGLKAIVVVKDNGEIVKSISAEDITVFSNDTILFKLSAVSKKWVLVAFCNNNFIYSKDYTIKPEYISKYFYLVGNNILWYKVDAFEELSDLLSGIEKNAYLNILDSIDRTYLSQINYNGMYNNSKNLIELADRIIIRQIKYQIRINYMIAQMIINDKNSGKMNNFFRTIRIKEDNVNISKLYELIIKCDDVVNKKLSIGVINNVCLNSKGKYISDRRCVLLDEDLNEIYNTEGYGIAGIDNWKYLKIYTHYNVVKHNSEYNIVDVADNFRLITDTETLEQIKDKPEATIFGIKADRRGVYNYRIGNELKYIGN